MGNLERLQAAETLGGLFAAFQEGEQTPEEEALLRQRCSEFNFCPDAWLAECAGRAETAQLESGIAALLTPEALTLATPTSAGMPFGVRVLVLFGSMAIVAAVYGLAYAFVRGLVRG